MPHTAKTFTVVDPTSLDGDCFEVAERALRQSAAVADVLLSTLPGARAMARNADMERQLYATGECDAAEFEDTAQARRLDAVAVAVRDAEAALGGLATAAGYNPRNPPKE